MTKTSYTEEHVHAILEAKTKNVESRVNRDPTCCDDLDVRVTCLEKQATGIPFAEPINNDGNLYPVELATHPVFLSHVSELSRLAPSLSALRICDIERLGGTWWRNVENECWIAVNPTNPCNMIVVTTQDFYSRLSRLSSIALYTLDGGVTWNQADITLSKCQGPTLPRSDQDWDITDLPTVAFDLKGNAYMLVTSFNVGRDATGNFDEANILIKSTDGGQSWTKPQHVTRDDGFSHFLDNVSIWNDPHRKNTLYQTTSDFLAEVGIGTENFTLVSRTVDGGTTWQPSVIAVVTPASFGLTNAPIHVLDDVNNTLVLTVKTFGGNSQNSPAQFIVSRSSDAGETWSQSMIFDDWTLNTAIDPADGTFIRALVFYHDAAINSKNGNLYVVAQDGRFAPPGLGGAFITMSSDGGLNWSDPIPVNPGTEDKQAFFPTVAVADDGTVGVLFYDFRFFKDGDMSLKTDVWLALYNSNLTSRKEIRLTPESFDARQYTSGRIFGTNGYFAGSYCKLQANGNDFVASFCVTNPPYGVEPAPVPTSVFTVEQRNRQDIIFARVSRKKKCRKHRCHYKKHRSQNKKCKY